MEFSTVHADWGGAQGRISTENRLFGWAGVEAEVVCGEDEGGLEVREDGSDR
jgi:hypothetical protein